MSNDDNDLSMPEPTTPARFTGGVDLTSNIDVTDPEAVADYLARLNAQPDVLQTISGGKSGLGISVGDMPGNDGSDGFRESKEHKDALNEVRTAFDGTPVRRVTSSRFRTSQWEIKDLTAPPWWIAFRDPRRQRLIITLWSSANNNYTAYVGYDLASVRTTGMIISTGSNFNRELILQHGDQVAFAPAAIGSAIGGNRLFVSVAHEYLE